MPLNSSPPLRLSRSQEPEWLSEVRTAAAVTDPGTIATPLSEVVHELAEQPDAERKQRLFEAIDLLLRAGANPRSGVSDQSPLELARLYSMPEVEQALLAKRQR